jgi:hypothetical protein
MQISCKPFHIAKNKKASVALITLNAILNYKAALVNLGKPTAVVTVLLAVL